MDRRQFLLGAAPATLAAVGSASCAPTKDAEREKTYAPTYFSATEWKFVCAAVARLIPTEGEGPGGLEAGVPEFIDRQMEMPYGHGAYFYMKGPFRSDAPPQLGYQLRYTPREIYRLGIAAADREAQRSHGAPFAGLNASIQDDFLKQMEGGQLSLPDVPAVVLFQQLLGNVREGYFADPLYGGNRGLAAWKWIGFPGARADFTDWVDQAGRPYPYGPVSISGERGD